jgi:N-acetyl-anhydromuramyl-L-alanine amidase AmpD
MIPTTKSSIFLLKVMTQQNVNSQKKFEDQQWGILPQLFKTLCKKHTITIKENLAKKNVSFSSHGNFYLSKFLGHLHQWC